MTPDAFVKATLSRHPYAVEDEKLFRSRKAELAEDWPDWCGLPMAAVQAILDSRGLTPIEQAAEMAPLTAALLWRRSKIIYRFDPALRDALAAQPLDGDIPADALYLLPYHCVHIEFQCDGRVTRCAGFLAWMEFDIPSRVPELRLLYLPEKDGDPIPQPVILAGTLEESMRALGRSAAERGGTLIPEGLRERMRTSGAPMTMPPDVIRASISLLRHQIGVGQFPVFRLFADKWKERVHPGKHTDGLKLVFCHSAHSFLKIIQPLAIKRGIIKFHLTYEKYGYILK